MQHGEAKALIFPTITHVINQKGGAKMAKCGHKTEVYSRVCGYFRPVANWNHGKKEEFRDRKTYSPSEKEKTIKVA